QVDFYTKYIASIEEWEMVDVYADEGLTGMETRHRDEFNRMIADCRDGKIDRILVKSISRFARNQEDYIYYMRELMRLGVTISFEKENIDTGKMTSEQAADIYGAFAQMETTGHSQNMRMSNRIRMEKGIFIPAKAPYGYRLINNELVVVPEESEVVRRIYAAYLSGHGIFDIMDTLNKEGIRHTNGAGKWNRYSINYILTNITYTGDQLWQKTFATDVIPFRKVRNKGQKPKYFAEDCGPAIIDKETYQQVQTLMAEKKEQYPRKPEVETVLHRRIYCAECGSLCKRKVCNGIIYWVCRRHDDGKSNCPSQQIPEAELEEVIRNCYGKLHHGRDTVLRPMLTQLGELRKRELRANNRICDIDREMARLAEQNLVLNRLKDKGYVDPALYQSQQDEINGKALELRRLRRKLMERTRGDETIRKTETMLEYLEDGPEWLDEIEPELFEMLIDRLSITADGQVKIRLINGLELTESLRKEAA
ncbi:MAG: recombinase family protein, partial [Selenomonadaceae bacterium]|nr:recombinase family protein [Selenomonadaceae bacterium]